MRISGIHNIQTFKGYDARPLKALYMKAGRSVEGQDEIYNELHKIGQDVGFDVYMNFKKKDLIENPTQLKSSTAIMYDDPWAQDDKIFVCVEGETRILYPKMYKNSNNEEASNLAGKLGIKGDLSSVWFEGGNVFVGTKDDGENYILLGEDAVADRRNCFDAGEKEMRSTLQERMKGAYVKSSNNSRMAVEDVISKFAYEFNVKKENVYIIKQPNCHLDMAIRPLEYPYVLVNDFDDAIEKTKQLKLHSGISDKCRAYRSDLESKQYATTEETIKELKKYGFKPIRIAGVFGDDVNFMNAIVHKKPDGSLCYITNSSECKKDGYKKFQEIFKKQLREKCPNMKDIYFVSGGSLDCNANKIMEALLLNEGGVHCMVAEEPKF